MEKAQKQDYREMSEGKRIIDAGVSDLDNGDSILVIKTEYDLLLLGLNGNQCGYKRLCDDPIETRHDDPVFLKIIDFESEGLPTEMGAMRLGNNRFFLFGGRKKVPHSPFGRLVKSVYKLVHDNDDWSLELTKEVKEPSSPKILPLVEEVNGNIFVLQDFYLFSITECPHIFLEAYDTTFNTWSQNPARNSWNMEEEAIIKSGSIDASFSVGHKIYIVMSVMTKRENTQCVFCFNTITFRWEEEKASNLQNSFNNSRVKLPVEAVCVTGIANLDVNLNVILYKAYNTALAYLIDDSGSLVCYQNLSSEFYIYGEEISHCSGESLLNHKSGGGRMCLVTKFPVVGRKWVIIIRDFELKLKQGFKEQVQKFTVNSEIEFLTVDVYNYQRFSIIDPNGADFGLHDAFFL